MSNDGWVTDPKVLDTICALKGMLPGDEVLLQGGVADKWIGVHTSFTDTVFTVCEDAHRQLGTRYLEHDPSTEIVAVCESTNWVLCRRNIKAWRRPCKSG